MQYKSFNKWTPNKSKRNAEIKGWTFHKTYGSPRTTFMNTVNYLARKMAQSGCEVVVDKDGTRAIMNPNMLKYLTWHAGVTNMNAHRFGKKRGVPMSPAALAFLKRYGKADWRGDINPNSITIGVEYFSKGEAITNDQIDSIWEYAYDLNKRAGIPLPTRENTFYHAHFSYWKEKVELDLFFARDPKNKAVTPAPVKQVLGVAEPGEPSRATIVANIKNQLDKLI